MHLWIEAVECGPGNGGHMRILNSSVVSQVSLATLLPLGEPDNGPSMGMNCAYSQSPTRGRMEATQLFWQPH